MQFDVPSGVLISSKFQKQVSRFWSSMKLIHIKKTSEILDPKIDPLFYNIRFSFFFPPKKHLTTTPKQNKKKGPIQPTKKKLNQPFSQKKSVGPFYPPGFKKPTKKKNYQGPKSKNLPTTTGHALMLKMSLP